MNIAEVLHNRYFDDWSNMSTDQIVEIIKLKSQEILSLKSLIEKLESNKKLKIKYGIDPTASDIHIGHIVPIMILNIFAKLGHQVDFVIGNFTAKIGDPSGRNTERKPITDAEIENNLSTYTSQLSRYFDISKINFHKNENWLSKMTASDLFGLFQNINLAQALQRDDFRKRMLSGGISLAEVCYAVLMGVDSAELNCDIEVGGIDQLLNFQQCKEVMKIMGKEPETVITTPILEGLSGDGRKMSKSYDNYVSVNASVDDKFGKIMSIADNQIEKYFICFSYMQKNELTELQRLICENPLEAKKQLGTYLVSLELKSLDKAQEVRENFERKFAKREFVESDFKILTANNTDSLLEVLFTSGDFKSKSELRRLLEQNSVRNIETDEIKNLDSVAQNEKLRVGKRLFYHIQID